MTIVPIMWMVWSAVVALTAALYIYRSNLTKDEEDQIFLDDPLSTRRTPRRPSSPRSTRCSRSLRVALWMVGVATLFVVGYYIVDVFNQFK